MSLIKRAITFIVNLKKLSLLKEFKSVKNVINAHPEKMQNVEKMGPKKTQEISRVLEESYKDD